MSERDWQPIKTAPKDGTTVLTYQGAYKEGDLTLTAHYDSSPYSTTEGKWLVTDGVEDDYMLPGPTHWMPLPGPPEETDDLLEFAEQLFNAIDTGMLHMDTPADETLANVLGRGRKALDKAKEDRICE